MKWTWPVAILFSACLVIGNLVHPSFAVDFTITVETDKPTYIGGETVTVSGNLTLDGGPVLEGALIALQIEGGTNLTVYRTLFLEGTTPPELIGDLNYDDIVDIFDAVIVALAFGAVLGSPNWDLRADVNGDNIIDIFDMVVVALNYGQMGESRRGVRISDVYFAGAAGNRVTVVQRGRDYWIWINVTNTEAYSISSVIAFTIFDANNVPVYALATPFEVGPTGTYHILSSWTMPVDMAFGIGRMYANAYSDEPKNLGYALCLEKSSGFEVVSGLASNSVGTAYYLAAESQESFATSFKVPATGAAGYHTVYVCSLYIVDITPFKAYDTADFEISP